VCITTTQDKLKKRWLIFEKSARGPYRVLGPYQTRADEGGTHHGRISSDIVPQTVYVLAGAGGVHIALPRRHARMCAIRAAAERHAKAACGGAKVLYLSPTPA